MTMLNTAFYKSNNKDSKSAFAWRGTQALVLFDFLSYLW